MQFNFGRSSSSDDSDIDDLIHDDDVENLILILDIKELGNIKKRKGRVETLDACRLCIPRDRDLDHKMLMKDCFAKICTPRLIFSRRYRMHGDLFVHIVDSIFS